MSYRKPLFDESSNHPDIIKEMGVYKGFSGDWDARGGGEPSPAWSGEHGGGNFPASHASME
jgi:hypothetical protein